MTMTQNGSLARDDNDYPVMGGTSSSDDATIINSAFDPVTRRLLTDASGGGSGTVTSVSVVSANGFAGSVANATTTPAITLTTTINSPVLAGNGTAISAATTTGTGSTVVLNNSPVFADDITLGVAASATGSILFKGLTSGTVTLTVADVAGTWTLQLPANDGDAGQFLQTNGSGVTSWATVSASAGGNNTEVQYNNAGALGGITGATSNGTTLTITSGRATTDFSPSSNDGAALGTTALGFADLHLATGGVINWANGEITITETNANLLSFAGGAYAFAGAITGTTSLTLGAAAGTTGSVVLTGTTSGAVTLSVADAAGTWTMKLPTTDGNANEFLQTDGSGNTTWAAGSSIPATTITVANEATDTTCFPVFVTAATGDLGPKSNAGLTFNSNTSALFSTLLSGNTVTANTAFVPDTDGGADLGTTTLGFQNIHLNTGATINIDNGNWVATHTSAILTVGTGDLRVTTAGTNTASVVTVDGTQTLSNKKINHTFEPASDDTFTGETLQGLNAGATIAQWDCVYLGAASKWLLTDADAASSAGGVMVAMATTSGTDTNPLTVILRGVVRNDGWTWATVGAPLYLDTTTAGGMTLTAPSGTDDVVKIVGYVLSDDCIYFNPSNDWITRV